MRTAHSLATLSLIGCLVASACAAQEPAAELVVSSDGELARLAAELIPGLAARSALELKGPVRIERRSRARLVSYLEAKLDEELPPDEAEALGEAYALLGLVPPDLDLRSVLLSLYTEQIVGFYEPDSTALFVLDDQPPAVLKGILVHELVHAIQDQNVDLGALTDPDYGNDRSTAAQAAIEGHATLVMLEYMTEEMTGLPVDLAEIPDFATQMRPALEGMRMQFPALANAPRVIQESLVFPYIEGTTFVQALWAGDGRVSPFGDNLPISTEQVMSRGTAEPPVELEITVEGGRVVREDVLGRLEVGILLEQHLGDSGSGLAEGWEGDRYALVDVGGGERGLVWFAVWEDAQTRDRVAGALEASRGRLGQGATVERLSASGRSLTLVRFGAGREVAAQVRLEGEP